MAPDETVTLTTADVGTLTYAETRADRLNRMLVMIFPTKAKSIAAGQWWDRNPQHRHLMLAPYWFDTTDDGQQRLLIENRETGDRMGFVGASRDDLLDQLEQRLTKGAAQ